MRLFVSICFALLLSACASTQTTAPAATAASSTQTTEAVLPSTDMADRLQASWVRTASQAAVLRSGRDIGVATLRELDALCQTGAMVEVIARPLSAQAVLRSTKCLRVWRTMHPSIINAPQVMVIDAFSLTVEGQLRHSNSAAVRNEMAALAVLKAQHQVERMR